MTAQRPMRSRAAIDVLAERRRQQTEEGWTREHDKIHDDRSLAKAAAAFALNGSFSDEERDQERLFFKTGSLLHRIWPVSWSHDWWKPKDRRRDLVRAGALIIAEIERLDRAEIDAQPIDF